MILQETVLSGYLNRFVSTEFLSKDKFLFCTRHSALQFVITGNCCIKLSGFITLLKTFEATGHGHILAPVLILHIQRT